MGEACAQLARLDPGLIKAVSNLKLAIDLRNRIIHGYDSVDDEFVYLIATKDLEGLKVDLARLLAVRG